MCGRWCAEAAEWDRERLARLGVNHALDILPAQLLQKRLDLHGELAEANAFLLGLDGRLREGSENVHAHGLGHPEAGYVRLLPHIAVVEGGLELARLQVVQHLGGDTGSKRKQGLGVNCGMRLA